jgi:hypothetical protein
MVTSDRFADAVVGILTELPRGGPLETDLLRAARIQAAIEMLRRSGFDLVLLRSAVQLETKPRRRWRRERNER